MHSYMCLILYMYYITLIYFTYIYHIIFTYYLYFYIIHIFLIHDKYVIIIITIWRQYILIYRILLIYYAHIYIITISDLAFHVKTASQTTHYKRTYNAFSYISRYVSDIFIIYVIIYYHAFLIYFAYFLARKHHPTNSIVG